MVAAGSQFTMDTSNFSRGDNSMVKAFSSLSKSFNIIAILSNLHDNQMNYNNVFLPACLYGCAT